MPKGQNIPRYEHLVWNRTDLTVSGKSGGGNLQVRYSGAKPPLISDKDPFINDGYKGEVIPPYAVLRVLTNPVYYKERICWIVGRPDDQSMSDQSRGLHFFNGPNPIPIGGWGEATNELPAPVLVDLTVDREVVPYGNLSGAFSSSASAPDVGWLLGYVSGSWALHPFADILNYGSQNIFQTSAALVSGSSAAVTVAATTCPYCIIGRNPAGLSGKTPKDTDSPEIAFSYSNQVFWVAEGALGFGSVTTQ